MLTQFPTTLGIGFVLFVSSHFYLFFKKIIKIDC